MLVCSVHIGMECQKIVSALEQHWNNLFECKFVDLGYVFAYFLRD